MRVIVVGCGRVGARVAAELDQRGETVTVVDVSARAFSRLPQSFKGETVRGNGTDEDVMRTAGAEQADVLMTLTEGDNRNVLAAQLAAETFGVKQVVTKINDPVRAEAYTMLGLATICRTRLLVDALARYSGLPADPGANGVRDVERHHDHDDGETRPQPVES
jgi:trk system potassium uptake protein TrkA